MKASLKSILTYIIAIVLALIGFIPFIVTVYFYSNPNLGINFDYYIYIILSYTAFLIILAWVIGDFYGMYYRHKVNDWSNDYPDKVKETIWKIRMPLAIAVLTLTIFTVVLYILFLINGCYPFTK